MLSGNKSKDLTFLEIWQNILFEMVLQEEHFEIILINFNFDPSLGFDILSVSPITKKTITCRSDIDYYTYLIPYDEGILYYFYNDLTSLKVFDHSIHRKR